MRFNSNHLKIAYNNNKNNSINPICIALISHCSARAGGNLSANPISALVTERIGQEIPLLTIISSHGLFLNFRQAPNIQSQLCVTFLLLLAAAFASNSWVKLAGLGQGRVNSEVMVSSGAVISHYSFVSTYLKLWCWVWILPITGVMLLIGSGDFSSDE